MDVSHLLDGLNEAQREAVTAPPGHYLVLAGAGSGKTRVLTHRIGWLLQVERVSPWSVLAVTFTNKAAGEMRARTESLIEGDGRGLTIGTFHGITHRLLRRHWREAKLPETFQILDADDQLRMVKRTMQGMGLDEARFPPRQACWFINGAKDEGKRPDALDPGFNPVNRVLVDVYRAYEDACRRAGVVDFAELLLRAHELWLQNDELLRHYRERFRHLLIDEFQDTNTLQYAWVRVLAGSTAQVFVVGDDDQAIYGWRGATLENLAQLGKDFPKLHVIKLEQNYRSTVRILTAANNVIANNPKLFEKKLWSEHGMGDSITVTPCNDEEHEAESVVFRLSAHKFERRAQFRDYAILYRGNFQARIFEQVLRRERIPYVLSGGQSFFDKAEIKDLCAYLRLIANADDDPAFIRAVTTPRRGIGNTTLEALGSFAGQAKVSLFEAVYMGGIEARLSARQVEPLRMFCDFIQRLTDRADKEPATVVLDDMMEAIHYEAYLYDAFDERQAQSKWQNVLEFLEWLKRKGTKPETEAVDGEAEGFHNADGLADTGKNLLGLIQTVALMSMLEGKDEDPDAVRLSTVHASKGLEYPHVFLVGVEEGIMPHRGGSEDDGPIDSERIEEERRLMYVAITRAQRSLHLNWCKKRKRARETVVCEPSRFIPEMGLDEAPPPTPEEAPMTPKDRLASLKALLQK